MLLVAGSTTAGSANGVGSTSPTVKSQKTTKAPAKKRLRPAKARAAPPEQPKAAAAQQAKIQPPQQPSAAPDKTLGSGDPLPVASASRGGGLEMGAFMGRARPPALPVPKDAVVGAAVPGLAGAVWTDRDRDGLVDGYNYNGEYYRGGPEPVKVPERG
jgi:hypothetical protein